MFQDLVSDMVDKALETLFALAMGDAYGVGFEFMDAEQIVQRYSKLPDYSIGGGPFDFAPGQFSDDTEMAALTLYSLHHNQRFDEIHLTHLYKAWAHVAKDVGIQTREALMDGVIDYRGEGNGALMRILPSAVYMKDVLKWNISKIHHTCEKISAITHNNYTVHAINIFFVDLMLGEPIERHHGLIELFKRTDGTNGWVMNTARIVYEAFGRDCVMIDGFKSIVAQGGDTDTNCAIYGALRGYRESIDLELRKRLLSTPSIELLEGLYEISLHRYYPDPNDKTILAGQYPGSPYPIAHAIKSSTLAQEGCHVIVNLMEEEELKRFVPYEMIVKQLNPSIKFMHIPIVDMGVPNLHELETALLFLDEIVNQKVYIHCWGGHGRTGTVVGAYLISCMGMEVKDALSQIRTQRLKTPFGDAPSPQTYEQIEFLYALNG